MKTSKFLTALVLPAMLAACTAEDIVTTNNVAQSERPMLSKDFKLISEGEGEGVNSRFYMAGSSSLNAVWEDGDKYGAALIDQYNPAAPRNPEQWGIIQSLAGNIPFIYDATSEEWTAVAATGVGHYLFSFPYNINDQNRAAVSWELPSIQELYNENGELDLNASINKYNKSVAAALLRENATSHSVKMRNLFSYPKFVIKFDNGLPVTTVSQVVLKYTNENTQFVTKGGFNHTAVWNLFNPTEIEKVVGKDKDYEDIDAYWSAQQTADFILPYEDVNAINHDKSQYIVAKLPENHKVVLDSDKNKCVEVRFMIPGDIYDYTMSGRTGSYESKKNFTMFVYTNDGVYEIEDVANNIVFKNTTPEDVRERVFARNASYTLTLKNITSASPKAENLNIVTEVEDWNALVDKYGASKAYKGASKALKVAVVGNEFILDETAEMPSVANFEITTDVTIEGEVTLSNVIAKTAGKKVIVAEGATLNFADDSNDILLVENNGTVNFKKAIQSRAEVVEVIDGIIEINNMPNATINVEEDAEAAFELNNKIAKELEGGNPDDLTHGILVNEGILALEGENSGEITNNGVITFNGDFVNNEKYATLTVDEENEPVAEFMPVITNNGEITVKDVVTNEGKFVNTEDATIACAKSGQFDNTGYVKVEDGSTLLITTNTGEGTIELEKYNQTKWEIEEGNEATILFYATAASYNFATSEVTKVITEVDDLTISKTGKLEYLVMNADATLTLPEYDEDDADADENGVNDTYFNGTLEVNADIVIESELAKVAKLIVSEEGSVTINKDNTVYAEATENAGAVLVAGAFMTDTETMEKATVGEGIFKSTKGSSDNIDFDVQGKVDEETTETANKAAAKTAYEAALVKAIEAWVAGDYTNGVQKVGYDLYLVDEDNKNLAAAEFEAMFAAWNGSAAWEDAAVLTDLQTKLNTYNGYLTPDVTVASSWSTAAATALTHLAQGGCEDADEDGKIDLVAGWVYDLSKLSWTPETLVYLDDAADVEEAKTAEEKALADFKAAVVAGTVLNNNTALSQIQKVLLNTNTTATNVVETIPAQSVVFAEDDIYKLFSNEAIGLFESWPTSDFTNAYQTIAGNASNWTLALVNQWIDEVSGADADAHLKIEMARDYIKNNGIINKAKSWKYADAVIQAIVTSYNRGSEVVLVGSVADLNEAIAAFKNVKLSADVNLTTPLVINGNITVDLNGKTLQSQETAIDVQGGNVTIKGNGTVKGGNGGDFRAVIAQVGSIVTIVDGTYTVGADAAGLGNSTIFANGGSIQIEGGEFSSAAMYSNRYWVLNVEQVTHNGVPYGEILVNGGTFKNFNPAAPNTDDNASYLASGKTIEVMWNGQEITTWKPYSENNKTYAELPCTKDLYDANGDMTYIVE